MVTATGSIRASGAHAATTPTRPKTIRPQPDAHETSPCSRAFSSASLMHLCSGKRCNLAPALTGRQSSLTTLLLLPGSSQADRSIPSLIKPSLDRPEFGSNPHGSPLRQRRLIAVREPTQRKKLPALSRDVHPRLSLKIKQSFMDTH